MSRIGMFFCHSLFYLFLMISMFVSEAIADPVIVAQTGANSGLSNSRQIVRTSTGRIYYLGGNAGHTSNWDGWLEVHTSSDGSSWSKESTRDQWYLDSDIGVSVDSDNVLHVVSYDWNHHPYYVKYNTADSPTANSTWDGYELLESTRTSDIGKCSVAVDANGKPHVVYQTLESYKGKTYYTLTYANRVGTAWSKVAVWPKELKTNFSGKIEIAIGRDNIPYILTGNKMLKGNANAATSFETKDLGSAGTSFVIQQNGDIKVARTSNGNYSVFSHDFTLPWSSGWTLAESTTPDTGSTLLLANDTLYAARLRSDGIWLQKNLDPPFLAASQPANTTWQSLTARWSSYNHSKQGVIDLGTRSWNLQNGNLLWYSANLADSRANFYGGPFIGVAPLTVSLSDSSISREGSNITSWQWDFDNDGTADASGPNATHVYTTPGKYSVSLAITDSSGGQDKIVRPNLIQVDGDSDGDGIPDSRDNCPFDYNPLQLDLNGNSIGDTCELSLNRIASALYMTGLRSLTSADSRKSTDVTGIMTDGLLNTSSTLAPATFDAISFTVNKEARGIKQLTLEYYALGAAGYPNYSYAYIMPYNSDFSTTVDFGMSGRVYNGWNVVDLTPILHRMDGFGKVKFRLAPRYSGFNVYELKVTEKVDAKELVVAPEVVDFGAIEIPKRTVQSIAVKNVGTETMNIVRVRAPSSPFSIDAENCSGKQLAPNASCSVSIAFVPGYNIAYQDVLIVDSDDVEQSSKRIKLVGSGTLVLSGVVKDAASGRPLGNVIVAVSDQVRTQVVTTDDNGAYSVSGLTPGGFTATFSRLDYVVQTINGIIYQSQTQHYDVQLALNYASISGNITDMATGLPLAGVNVALALTGISSKEPADRVYLCNNSALSNSDKDVVAANDEVKNSCLSGGRSNSMVLKVRNPYGADPFTVSWNGMGASSNEYLAQSFKPVTSGKLNRISFYLSSVHSGNYFAITGEMYVQLKSKLGGDISVPLAESDSIRIANTAVGTWVDFTFSSPATVTAGQEYFLEIQGKFEGGDNYWQSDISSIGWGDGAAYADGGAYKRNFGLWSKLNNSLAFRAYLDSQLDVSIQTSPGQTSTVMQGSLDPVIYTGPYNNDRGTWEDKKFNDSIIHRTYKGEYVYSSADLTRSWNVSVGVENYYDQNGWLMVFVGNGQIPYWNTPPNTSLLTDQFSLTFNRMLTTVTDANGAYSFPNLPEGNYTVVVNKPSYSTKIVTGALQSGQAVSINPAITVNTGVRIVTNTLAVANVDGIGWNYRQVIAASGGSAPYTWSIIGGQLPDGVTLNSSTGEISGRFVTVGNCTFIVKVQDANKNIAAKPFTIKITQTLIPARINVLPAEVSFGGINTGKMLSSDVTVTNASMTDLAIGQISRPSEPFQVTIDNCSGKTLAAAATCNISIQFSPSHIGSFYDNFDIPSSDETYPVVSVFLSGAGIINYFLPDTGRGEQVKNPLSFTINNETSVTDNNTHLMWQRSNNVAAMTWPEAGAFCRDLVLDGYHDWRLPSFLELATIVDYGSANPAIAMTAFPGTSPDNYWTTFEGIGLSSGATGTYAVAVNFAYGEAHPLEEATSALVRCTRGETLTNSLRVTGSERYYPYTDGVISTDQSAGLIWAGNPVASRFDPEICDLYSNCFYLSQFNDCRALKYAGKQDWRNPTIKELATLFNQPCYQGSCITLSATPSNKPDASGVLSNVLMFSPGVDILSSSPSATHSLACVRGGNQTWGISGLAVSGITANSVVISWDTSQPANGEVQYGETSAYGSSTINTALTTQHTITVGNLTPETTYHYRVASTNGQGVAMHSDDLTFTTPRFSASNLGDVGNVTAMEITGNFDGENPDGSQNDLPRKAVAAEYFKTHPDKDFLIFFSSFDYTMPEGEVKGFYTEVKNDTQGINRTILDNSAQYGSAGMLQGTIDMGNITQLASNPYGPKLEEVLTTLGHELGHRWLAAVRFKNPDGTLNTALIGRDDAHWSYLLDSKGSLMYGNGWKENGDGTFTSTSVRYSYSPLDLYLMGMIPKEQVPPMLLIDNPAIDKTKLPELGATITGTVKTVTINDIIAASGERIPSAATSPKSFNIGFVLLTRPGDNTAVATQAVETVRKAFAGRFAELTQGKGSVGNVAPSLEIVVDGPADGATVTGPDLTVSGSFINTTGVETGIIVNGIPATVNGNRFIANHVPLQQGNNSITITATDANGLTATASRSVTAQAGNYIRITSNIESGTSPLNISLRLDSSFSIANPQLSVTGPVSFQFAAGNSAGEYTASLTAEGAYTFAVSAIGPDGQSYAGSITIIVLKRQALETLLLAKWESMKQKLASGDVEGAVVNFVGYNRTKYRDAFVLAGSALPAIAAQLFPIELVQVDSERAKFRMMRNENVMGQQEEIEYVIYFIKENGIWKLRKL